MKFQQENIPHLGEVYLFFCPGCGYSHWVRNHGNPRWDISGVENDRPTVSPSVVVDGQYRCHSIIRDGRIQYLRDSTHQLSGQTKKIPDFDD
jgi:hypothetical protein